jgi:hypothetical protein
MMPNVLLHATIALCMPYGIHSAIVADIFELRVILSAFP